MQDLVHVEPDPLGEFLNFPNLLHSLYTDEFGTAFEVTNCSICRHWVTSNDGVVTFSAGYNGCHVIKKVRFSSYSCWVPYHLTVI